MSTFEYNDLFLACQDTGKYHVFIFDIAESKKMNNNTRRIAQEKLFKLMRSMYSTIREIQTKLGKQILVFEQDFVSLDSSLPIKEFGLKQEPFILGDVCGFTIYRDSLDKETVLGIYQFFKDYLDIDFDFHLADGYYETNDYSLGNTLYFRGYCIDLLSRFHKIETKKDINRLNLKLNKHQ